MIKRIEKITVSNNTISNNTISNNTISNNTIVATLLTRSIPDTLKNEVHILSQR